MSDLTAGKRLRSTVSDAEVIVIRPPHRPLELHCGGHPMDAVDAASTSPAAVGHPGDDVIVLGKRYVDDESGLEVLCTKSGTGVLVAEGRQLAIKAPKALPASD
ncbi:hypothetical protein ACRDU6_09675 [Mycolicibacterium sp. ELW1]|uniref:hypothetical protein n=1 Tax=Mycobacteriaceae TaxID=1762 RepID=UPI0011EDDF0E|nr:hypothetical protein [Mycobacterium sp. ELW1]QEN12917.1 hypothetical protein D3H54_06220 [Mycobacterium sp. ELW1]